MKTVSRSLSNKNDEGIQQMTFFNMMFYSKFYGDFSLNVITDEPLENEEIAQLFDEISEEILYSLVRDQQLCSAPMYFPVKPRKKRQRKHDRK